MMFHLQDGYTGELKDRTSERSNRYLHDKIVRWGAGLAGVYALVEILSKIVDFFCGVLPLSFCY